MITDMAFVLDTLSFSDEELSAITYAQYIAEHIDDPIENEFSDQEKQYYKSLAINALVRNIAIYEREMNHIDPMHSSYPEILFNYRKFVQCLHRII